MPNSKINVLLIGATGLVGALTLQKLLQHDAIEQVRVITRRTTGINNSKLTELCIDFEQLNQHKDFMQCDVFISCLGSTMKKAGNKKNFENFDLNYPLTIARYCKENGTQKMVLLSAMGANPDSFVFYNKIKGRLESECIKLAFDELSIIRPSLIVGNRQEKRLMENVAEVLMRWLNKILPVKAQSVTANQLAATMLKYTLFHCEEHVQIIDKNNFA